MYLVGAKTWGFELGNISRLGISSIFFSKTTCCHRITYLYLTFKAFWAFNIESVEIQYIFTSKTYRTNTNLVNKHYT